MHTPRTLTYHGGGVAPVVVDGRARREHALVGGGHVVAHSRVRVSKEALGDAEVGIGVGLEMGGAEEEASRVRGRSVEVHAARAGARARGELLEVVNSLEHCSVYVCIVSRSPSALSVGV